MISHDTCNLVLETAVLRQKSSKLLCKDILGGNSESVFYIDKMHSSYIANLAFQAREAKKRLGWESVWMYNGNVCIKTTDQSPVITISLLSQLEAIAK